MLSGKIAAMAVYDPDRAQREFERFTRQFRALYFFKKRIFSRIRPQVDLIETSLKQIGIPRMEHFLTRIRPRLMGDGAQRPISYPYAIDKTVPRA